jgi:hypothetical protein
VSAHVSIGCVQLSRVWIASVWLVSTVALVPSCGSACPKVPAQFPLPPRFELVLDGLAVPVGGHVPREVPGKLLLSVVVGAGERVSDLRIDYGARVIYSDAGIIEGRKILTLSPDVLNAAGPIDATFTIIAPAHKKACGSGGGSVVGETNTMTRLLTVS